jgi:hypothetical protein
MRLSFISVVCAVLLAGCGTFTWTPPGGEQPTEAESAQAPSSASAPSQSAGGETATPSEPATLKEAQARVRDGVIRLEVTRCDDRSTGTGFAISEDHLVTAAHVVESAAVIRVIEGKTSRAGFVVGVDRRADVALVEVRSDLKGHEFVFTKQAAEEADQVGILGYPRGEPLTYTQGEVTGTNRKVTIEGLGRYGLLQTSARVEPGNSGGPVFDAQGSVVGVVSAGVDGDPEKAWAVAAEVAEPLVSNWLDQSQTSKLEECNGLTADGDTEVPAINPTSAEFQAASTLQLYFDSINQGDYPTALAQLADSADTSLEEFEKDVSTSSDSDFEVRSVWSTEGGPAVWLEFTSSQDAGAGPTERPDETCTRWSLDYSFTKRRGLWLIDKAAAHEGARNAPC